MRRPKRQVWALATGVVTATLLASFAATATADDLIPPPWNRGAPGTTYVHFDSWIDAGGFYVGDSEYNPIDFAIGDAPGSTVLPDYAGRTDVLEVLGGDPLVINIPNYPPDNPYKDIYLQLTWHFDGVSDVPYTDPMETSVALLDQIALGDDWYYERWHIRIEPNPPIEDIYIWPLELDGPLLLDQVVVDTRCVPEPSSLAILAFAGLAIGVVIRRRR